MPEQNDPQETPEAAAGYAEYAAMGQGRSLEGLVQQRVQNGSKASRRLATIKEWSSKYNWQERIKLYDAAQIERERVKRQKAIDAMNDRHAMIGTTQQAKAIEQIKALIEAKSFGSMAAVQLLKLATDLERVARGAPTERSEVTGQDGEPLTTGGAQVIFYLPKVDHEEGYKG